MRKTNNPPVIIHNGVVYTPQAKARRRKHMASKRKKLRIPGYLQLVLWILLAIAVSAGTGLAIAFLASL